MKLTCDACKLTLNARDEDRGKAFSCPICKAPLRELNGTHAPTAQAPEQKPPSSALEWSGGTLDDLLYMVNAQALAASIEVHQPDKKGEIHVLAGGIDEAYAGDLRSDEAMEALRKATHAKFRVELRLPGEETGSIADAGPDRGDLKVRPLARLMRYCESYVLTCDLEVWRGNETCRVEYRRGNIARTLINGLDAPEQLGDIMGWTAGSYRFVLPRLALPQAADEVTRAQAKAAAETTIADQKARKTVFGIPAPSLGVPMPEVGHPAPAPTPMAAAPSPAQTLMMRTDLAPQPQPQGAAPGRNMSATIIGMPSMAPTERSAPPPSAAPPPASAAHSAPSVVVDASYAAALVPPAPEPIPTIATKDSTEPLRRESKRAAGQGDLNAQTARTDHYQEEEPSGRVSEDTARWVRLGVAAVGAAVVGWLLVHLFVR